jgi:hypothetical protein
MFHVNYAFSQHAEGVFAQFDTPRRKCNRRTLTVHYMIYAQLNDEDVLVDAETEIEALVIGQDFLGREAVVEISDSSGKAWTV